MENQINLVRPKNGTLPLIAKAFGLSLGAVSQHLNGYTNNERSQKIRRMALELGGSEYLPNTNNK